MTITALSLTINRAFLSRYEPTRSTLRAVIAQAGGATGDVMVTTLTRQTAGADLLLTTITTTLGVIPALSTQVEIRLDTLKDADGVSTVRVSQALGDYTLRVTAGAVSAEANFTVAPITPESLKSSYMRGIPLTGSSGATLDDEAMMEEVLRNYAYVVMMLHTDLEPTTVVTEKILEGPNAPASYDRIGEPVGFYRQEATMRWLAFQVPYRNLLKIHQIQGWFNLQKAVDITPEWQVKNTMSSLVQLVPSNHAILQWQFLGVGIQAFLVGQMQIPNFWQYHVTVGLRAIPLEILQFIGKRAAMSLLSVLGALYYAPGVVSTSLSRDGVSESRSLNPKGVYGALIDAFDRDTGRDKDGKEALLLKFRARYAGMSFTTL